MANHVHVGGDANYNVIFHEQGEAVRHALFLAAGAIFYRVGTVQLGELAGLDARRDELAGPLSLEALRAALAPGSLLLTWSVDEGAERLFLLHPAGAPGAGFQSFPVSPSLRDNLAVFSRAGLYQRLLGPAEAALATAEHLVLVPCHELRTVPFADLLRGETRLGEQKRIETAVSANAWARR